ncbi:MAG: DNA topoisomerase IV subunit A [Verrucomicrobiota bacterium]|nr:DNA topoisomerase IV subunit A [Verrucomicrobiota bacterium]
MSSKKKKNLSKESALPIESPYNFDENSADQNPSTEEDSDSAQITKIEESTKTVSTEVNQWEGSGLQKRMDSNFLEYASYVIRDRAIPSLIDGLKPVQRRIMWSLHQKDDGKFIKVANIVGHCMQYHPHGDASIGDALVVLTNKRYLIEGQGNFGNLFTGDPAAAARYIECRLTELARTQMFNDELTEFVPSYDGRNKEPVCLPSKLPLLLMLGAEGIAVGLSAKILPHNFCELLEAQVAILRKKPFHLLPDFPAGGLMDATAYEDGRGSVKIRAKIEVIDQSTLHIAEIPPATTTESLIASIEDAVRKGKLKVRSINDFTSEKIEIEIKSPPGVHAEKLVPALYAFTGCETSISSRLIVIRDNRPVEMTVREVMHANTEQLVDLLRRELELKEQKLLEDLFFKTLVRIFIENRIYKKIEKCTSSEAIYKAIYKGFEPFSEEYYRELKDNDIEMLLSVRIRRISLFDINRHKEEIEKVQADLDETRRHLRSIVRYAINHLKGLLKQYGKSNPRRTQPTEFVAVTAKQAAFKSLKFSYDRAKGYLGHKVSGDEFQIACSKYDKLVVIFKDGRYKMVEVPDKLFVGKDVIHCEHPNRDRETTMAYQCKGVTYLKRFTFGGMILNKDYRLSPEKSKILFFETGTPELLYIKYKPALRQKVTQQIAKPGQLTVKSAKAKGNQISIKDVHSIRTKPPRNWDNEVATTELRFL